MTDEDAPDDAGGTEVTATGDDLWARTTAPQSAYTTRDVGIGLAVFAVLALFAFGLPLALT